MRKGSLFQFCTPRGGAVTAVAREAQAMVWEAASPVRPGETIKAQVRRACRALGYPDGSWRVQAAWYGHAGCWSAQAMQDLQARFIRWREREAARRIEVAETEKLTRARKDREELEAARAAYRTALARVERQLAACDAVLAVPLADMAGAPPDRSRHGAAAAGQAHRALDR